MVLARFDDLGEERYLHERFEGTARRADQHVAVSAYYPDLQRPAAARSRPVAPAKRDFIVVLERRRVTP